MRGSVLLLCFALLLAGTHPRKRHRHRGRRLECSAGWGARKSHTGCERCIRGETYSPSRSTGACRICSRCGAGLYEARMCTPTADTLCDDCLRVIHEPRLKENREFQRKCGYLFLRRRRA